MAGQSKSACSALPEPPCCSAQGKREHYASGNAEVWACSGCGFAITDGFILLHRTCLFSSSRFCKHLSPTRPRRFCACETDVSQLRLFQFWCPWRAAILPDDNFRARCCKWLKKLEEREITMGRRHYPHICVELFPVLPPLLSAQAVKDARVCPFR